jgi:hypothetical protein
MAKPTINRNGKRVNSELWKVRFHLANGKHYMHWQVKSPNGEEFYFNPNEVTIEIEEAYLKVDNAKALSITKGGEKQACAWIMCEEVRVLEGISKATKNEIKYNPRKHSHFTLNDGDTSINKQEFTQLITVGNKVFINKN